MALVLAVAIAITQSGGAFSAAGTGPGESASVAAAARAAHAPYAVGEIVVSLTDTSRYIRTRSGALVPRQLITIIRYPAVGRSSITDQRVAPPARGPFPLIVFGHGYNITPAPYAQLLQAWSRAGYVVAAPLFPLSNSGAPGGADEADIVNQPRDMSFVITQLIRASARSQGVLAGLVNSHEIAVAGHSDGGETALAAAYDSYFLDRRIGAAVILSGAELPHAGFYFPASSPPLLATQGTADPINQPHYTYDFWGAAPQPKFLLQLLGASHLPPYTYEQPQLGIVERVSIAFLDRYLKQLPGSRQRLWSAGQVPGLATLR